LLNKQEKNYTKYSSATQFKYLHFCVGGIYLNQPVVFTNTCLGIIHSINLHGTSVNEIGLKHHIICHFHTLM